MPADQRHDHHVRSGRGLSEREHRGEIRLRHPLVHLDHLPLHLGQDGIAAAEREQRKLAENGGKGSEIVVHWFTSRFVFDAMKIDIGVSTSITGSNGKRSNAIATKASTAMTAIDTFLRKGHATFTAIDTSRPA